MNGKSIAYAASNVMKILMQYDCRKKIVRELENIIVHYCIMCQCSKIELKQLSPELHIKDKEILKEKTGTSHLNSATLKIFNVSSMQHFKTHVFNFPLVVVQ